MPDYDATISITTKNRKDDLAKAVLSALAQTDARVEVLVVDDGSTDGTAEMLAREHPAVRVVRHEQSAGYIVRRNQAGALALGPVLFSIDDDAVLTDPLTVRKTLALFADPRVGAVSIPYDDVLKPGWPVRRAPDRNQLWLCSEFRGTAYAVRRDLFVALGGYREVLFHQCEEADYCIRLLDAGYLVAVGDADPIHHFESPKRDLTRQMIHGSRNNVLFAWHNVPMPRMLVHALGTAALTLRAAIKGGYARAGLTGLFRAARDIALGRLARAPVSPHAYTLYRALRRGGVVPIDAVADRLPTPKPVGSLHRVPVKP